MYHSITFGNKNTWDEWHLVPTSRPKFNTPPLKSKYLDISGGNGIIDVSESLTGYPIFGNREGSFEFLVMNDYKSWEEAYSDILDYIHGRRMIAFLEDDPKYYYFGRFTVNEWRSEKNNSMIVIDYSVEPYKTAFEVTKQEEIPATVLNNYFVFGRDFYGNAPVCPTLTIQTTGGYGMDVRFVNAEIGLDVSQRLSDGTHQIPDFLFVGESTRVYLKVDNTSLTLQDSSGNPIFDDADASIGATASGNLSISLNKGRL